MKREYVADEGTLLGAERFFLAEGKGKGVECYRLFNGRLDLTVVLDRCMDVYRLFYRGKPVSYLSKNGLVSPRLCETAPYAFVNSFDAGFLYTCGLDNIGAPAEKKGRLLPQHGSLSYLPAENVHVERGEREGTAYLRLKGKVTFSALFGSKLVLEREIELFEDADTLTVRDTVSNEGAVKDGYMLMYHCNIGYPVLDERATLFVDKRETELVSAAGDIGKCFRFEAPTPTRQEEVFLHTLKEGNGCKARVKNGDFTLEFFFDPREFPYLVEWKSMACGDYVLGVEPCTIPMPERRERTLAPGEKAAHSVTWKFSDN